MTQENSITRVLDASVSLDSNWYFENPSMYGINASRLLVLGMRKSGYCETIHRYSFLFARRNNAIGMDTDAKSLVLLPLGQCRSMVLQLSALVGSLCQDVLQTLPLDRPGVCIVADSCLRRDGAAIMRVLLDLSRLSAINLEECIETKMVLNRMKYPAALCKVSVSIG